MPTEKKPGFRKNWACAGAIAVLATAVVHATPWAEADGFQHCRRDFIGTWQHTATVIGVDGGIAVQVGARSDGRTVRWQLEDGYLVARDDQPGVSEVSCTGSALPLDQGETDAERRHRQEVPTQAPRAGA